MITLNFISVPEELKAGISEISKDLNIRTAKNGIALTIEKTEDEKLIVSLKNKEAFIKYNKKHHFFRGLGLLAEAVTDKKKEFYSEETPRFTLNGPMFDVSQGSAVINVESSKKTFRQMALMGLNMFMFYCEDSFDVKEQPYFGYMRARYSEGDIRELDAYADMFGIELIPCIQTLAHLIDVLKWNKVYASIREDDECLFVGEEKTYEFIRDLIVAASRPFKTKRIHIGMDEAWNLGRGSYLSKHGYVKTSEIMKIHLEKVMEIVRELGLEPMMWSDMIFRSVYGGYYVADNMDKKAIPQEVIDGTPKDISLIYWDYYHNDPTYYERMLKAHRTFSEPIFAGGSWTWIGFGPHWKRTFLSTNAGLSTCKKLGIKEVFVTIWGDNGTEAPYNVNMLALSLYAEHGYCDELDTEKFKKRFEFCTGANYDDFLLLEDIDNTPGVPSIDQTSYNPSKPLMWQDILTGMFDYNIQGLELDAHYEALASKLYDAIGRNGDYNDMFRFYYNVANTLAKKSQMGLRITEAYKANDRKALLSFAQNELPELISRVRSLRDSHYELWFKLYKALGWDLFDMRYGSLIIRIESAIREIKDYLDGKLERIEELEEERLPYNGEKGIISYANYYGRIVSPSRIASYC